MRVRNQLASGVLPAAEMIDGLLIAVAAVLLIIPGVLTDILGLALLLAADASAAASAPSSAQFTRRSPLGRFTHEQADGADATAAARGDQIIDARVIETRVVDESTQQLAPGQ